MKKTQKDKSYVAPKAEYIELQIEQCIAASGEVDGAIDPFGPNDLVTEFTFGLL